MDAFPEYVVLSSKTGPGFYIFVLAYTSFCFFLIAPLVKWSRNYEKRRYQQEQHLGTDEDRKDVKDCIASGGSPTKQVSASSLSESHSPTNITKGRLKADSAINGDAGGSTLSGGLSILLRELDKVAGAEYPDRNPDFRSHIGGSAIHHRGGHTVASGPPTEHSSGVPSAATTSRLHANPTTKKGLTSMVLDVSGRRWKHRRPIGRVDVIQNVINNRFGTNTLESSSSSTVQGKKRVAKGMSDIASSVLEAERPQYSAGILGRSASIQQRPSFFRGRPGSYSAASERSVMSSIVDDISPNDAADANDPGRGNIFLHQDAPQPPPDIPVDSGLKIGCFSTFLEALLELALPTDAMKRVVRSSFPLAAGAMSEALSRLVTAAFISNYLGTESMVAYLLVGLFVRLTSEELAGAIIDALSTFVQAALFSGEENTAYMAGQYVQLAILLQLVLGFPLLLVWAMTMESVVFWLVQSTTIAKIAEEYTFVVVVHYLVSAVSRTFTVIFHICGHEHFESIIDITAITTQLIIVACVVALVDNADLTTVGFVQLIIGVAAAVAKVLFPFMWGWMKPFRKGLCQSFALRHNRSAFWNLARATLPLFVGTVLEYGEWEVLTIFLRHLGAAEVATWALLGAVWDVLESFTEGIGESAAIQVTFLLAAGHSDRARMLSNTVIYLALIQSLLVTSGLYMSGKYLAVLFTSDVTIQHLFNNAVALIGLANTTMAFSQISWSLVGAQGRFRLATSIVFFCRWLVTIPTALVAIFAFFLDLNAVSGALVVGYSSSSCALLFVVLRSDWARLSRLMQEMNTPMDTIGQDGMLEEDADPFDDFDDDDDSDSEGFGFDEPSQGEESSLPSKATSQLSTTSSRRSKKSKGRKRSSVSVT